MVDLTPIEDSFPEPTLEDTVTDNTEEVEEVTPTTNENENTEEGDVDPWTPKLSSWALQPPPVSDRMEKPK